MRIFLKLGGSLITEKSRPQTARHDVLAQAALEIREALNARPSLCLLIGHGSGSFGHTLASQYATQAGVSGREGWIGFAQVSVAAAELNHLVLTALDRAGVPVFRVQPSASALCQDGELVDMATQPIERALQEGLIPLVYGDVAIDAIRGGTIMSTEAIFAYLAERLHPQRILLAGDYPGVIDSQGRIIPHITPTKLAAIEEALGGSEYRDVTGGMAAKVKTMLALCTRVPGLTIQIFPGDEPGMIRQALLDDGYAIGTRLSV